jgi:NAD(P)-dependent dehydrogenase (short-subunit alcohol dehydrogenase family)
MEFEAKTALITGGGQGIGAATARRLVAAGANVVVADIDAALLGGLEAELGGQLVGVEADCGVAADIERAIETAVSRFGGLDILVCGAIHRAKGAFLDVTEDELDRALAVNIKGYFLSVQKAVPHFRAKGGGKVVLISSTFGFVGAPDFSVYCTTKGSVVNMTRTLAFELARENINVNAVAPGPIMTEGMAAMIARDPTIEGHRTAGMPLPRFGTPDEVADSILFLASDQARYLHGHNLVVDGGYLAV